MTHLETWIIIVVSMTVGISIFSIAQLLMRNSQRREPELFLIGFLGLYGLIKLDQLYLRSNGYEVWPHLAGIMFAVQMFLPATLYFYARAITSPSRRWLQLKDSHAFITPLIAALVASPYYLLTAEEKIALMHPLTRDPELYNRAMLGCQIGLTLFVITALVYLTYSFNRFKEHNSRLRMLFSRIDDKQIDWLRWMLLILALGWTWYAISEYWLLTGTQPRSVYLLTVTLEMIWIGFIAIRGINQAPIYDAATVNLELAETQTTSNQETLYTRSGLTLEDREKIADQLTQAMEQDHLYRDPELSLRTLSDKIKVSEINISETFSQHLQSSFFDFVNRYRVAEACKILTESDNKVLAVAFDSGFNSRSTFSAAFKKHMGVTPSEFRKQNRDNSKAA